MTNNAAVGTYKLSEFKNDTYASVFFEPRFPYIYLPTLYWNEFADAINAQYKRKLCDKEARSCKWTQNCETVFDGGHSIIIRLSDKKKNFADVFIDSENLLEPGVLFGDTNDTCYLSVFSNPNGPQENWYLGTKVMEHNYVVYDATPKENGQNSLRIGLGIPNSHGFVPEIATVTSEEVNVEPYSLKDGLQQANEKNINAQHPPNSPFDDKVVVIIVLTTVVVFLAIIAFAIVLY